MDWNVIQKQISADDQNKWDFRTTASKFRISELGALALSKGNSENTYYALSDHAISQFCRRLEIPVSYYRRLPNKMKATVANFDLCRLREKSYLVRGKAACVPGCGGKSILRYPSLKFFFHNCLITNDLKSAKA